MEGKKFTPQEEREIRKIKRTNCIIFGFFVLLAIMVAIWLGTYLYWHTFTSEKWQANPERRATMVADLLADYQLVGMTEDVLVALLGPSDNDYGYFNQDGQLVYCLGNERTIIDREWLLVELEDGIVCDYSLTTD